MATKIARQGSNWWEFARSVLAQTGDLKFEGVLEGDDFEVNVSFTVNAPTGSEPSIVASGMATWSG